MGIMSEVCVVTLAIDLVALCGVFVLFFIVFIILLLLLIGLCEPIGVPSVIIETTDDEGEMCFLNVLASLFRI